MEESISARLPPLQAQLWMMQNSQCKVSMETIIHCAYLIMWYIIFPIHLVPIECNPECENGDCAATNYCECNEGWRGPTCSHGINTFVILKYDDQSIPCTSRRVDTDVT